MAKKKVYLAGKVNGAKWDMARLIDDDLAEFYASDGGNHSEHKWGYAIYEYGGIGSDDMHDFALKPIQACDMLIAYLDQPDSFGSVAEIAWASAHGKPCYLLINDVVRSSRLDIYDNSMHDAYWFISNFPGVVSARISDFIEAACIVDNLLKIESPIEKLFYDTALAEDPFLAFSLSAQHKVKTPDFTYRVDFMLMLHDLNLAIELDGHDSHKTKNQRTHDAKKDRYMHKKGITTVRFTGSEVWKNPRGCVKEISEKINKYRLNDDDIDESFYIRAKDDQPTEEFSDVLILPF